MSLASLAVRTCAVLAIYGRTLAGARVFDSALQAIDERVKSDADDPRPFVTIAVDAANGQPKSHDLLGGASTIDLTIEMGSYGKVEVAGGVETVRIPMTDPGLEWSLDLLGYQVARILTHETGWADLFRRFVTGIDEITRVRGGMSEKGDRHASRQIVLTLDILADPVSGDDVPDGPWADFLAALRALGSGDHPEHATFAQLADAIEAAIEAPTLPDWRRGAAALGVAIETADAIGFTPVPDVQAEDVVPTINVLELLDGSDPTDPVDGDRADEIDGGAGEY